MPEKKTPFTVEWLGTTYRIMLTPEETGGHVGLFESLNRPGYGPPRHIHNKEDETFHVLSGEIEFWMAGKARMTGPGDTVFIARGTEHTFRVVGNLPARMLTVMTPGGFEGFFAEMARKRCRIPEDMEQVIEIGAYFNLTFTGPPLGVVL